MAAVLRLLVNIVGVDEKPPFFLVVQGNLSISEVREKIETTFNDIYGSSVRDSGLLRVRWIENEKRISCVFWRFLFSLVQLVT